MRDTSSLEYDEHHDNNLYSLTLSSKAVERSGSRAHHPRMVKADSIESVISTIPSVKNRKQPPIFLVPHSMNKNTLKSV
jgi:hypothetical protein